MHTPHEHAADAPDEGYVAVPRSVRFPVQLRIPESFDPNDITTWPRVDGRLEYVGGRLLYMPPCGQEQGAVTSSTVTVIGTWLRDHREFRGGTLEIGITLGGDTRGADAAVWRKDQGGPVDKRTLRFAPLLAVEIAGQDEDEEDLREKARWYIDHGVRVVWLVFPDRREVVILRDASDRRFRRDERLPEAPELPGLSPLVAELFDQLDE